GGVDPAAAVALFDADQPIAVATDVRPTGRVARLARAVAGAVVAQLAGVDHGVAADLERLAVRAAAVAADRVAVVADLARVEARVAAGPPRRLPRQLDDLERTADHKQRGGRRGVFPESPHHEP